MKQISAEISVAYGPTNVSYDTVRRRKKKLDSGLVDRKCTQTRPVSVSCAEIVPKGKEIVKIDARYTVHDILSIVWLF